MINKIKNLTLRKLIILMSGTAFSQILFFLFLPILTRLYSPELFGTYALFTSIIGIVVVLTTLKLEKAIVASKKYFLQNNLLFLGFCSTFLISSMIFLFLVPMLTIKILDGINYVLFYIGAIVTSLLLLLRHYLLKHSKYKEISLLKVFYTVILLISQFSFFYINDININGLILGNIVSSSVVVGIIIYRNKNLFYSFYKKISLKKSYIIFKMNINYPKFMVPVGFLNAINSNLLIVFLSFFYGATETGLVFLVLRVLKTPSEMISSSISNINFQEFSDKNKNKLLSSYISRRNKLLKVSVILCIPVFILLPYLFKFLFGEEWIDSGIIGQVMLIGLIARFVMSPFLQTFNILGEQRIYLYWSLIRLIILIIVLLVSNFLINNLIYVLFLYSLFEFIMYLIVNRLLISILKKVHYE